MQQMMDDIHQRDDLLDAAKARDSRLLAENQKAEEDLKRVTSNLVEERVIWARDIQEKERVIAHTSKVQGELERKAVMKAEKVRAQTSQVARLNIDHEFVSQVQEQHHALMADMDVENSRRAESENAPNQALAEVQELSAQLAALRGEKSWWISHGLTSCFEFLRRSSHFSSLLENIATVACETGQHDRMHAAYSECGRPDLVTEELRSATASASTRMAETFSTVANDPLP
ncbi:hypothetical protein HanPSC8_Chr01g0011261 [Helianthus annuus]|nr:hypothetical protein HanHA89_Chr01g0010291 [Helianthus annuus]KAJ0782527.1 hypothetical protein HanLR1_Chr01g0009231 [Helianthus annuus]KAJ0956148.1 hypothetical protein HanPSC8_Chr01g0011261 [Helianthus annuus]